MISIIIPTFNRALLLAEAVQSVLEQTYFQNPSRHDFEILIVDDGSTDRTRQLVESWPGQVRYYFQGHGGVSSARNRGLELARGEFIAFLDSDDLWLKDKIGAQMSYMKAFPAAKMCYTEEIWIRKGVWANPKEKHKKYSGWIFDKVLPLCLISLSSALFRREVFDQIGQFDESLPACEDYDFGLRLAYKFPVHLLSKPLIIKRGGHPDQLSRKYWGMDRFRVKALEKMFNLNLSPEQEKLVKQEIVRKSRILADGFLKRKKKTEAEKYLSLIKKYKYKPNNVQNQMEVK